jgi:hypothetical protein
VVVPVQLPLLEFYLFFTGPLPIKVVRDAILHSEEEKAITVLTTEMLSDKTFNVNAPISTTKGTGVTLLHLAAQFALQQLVKVLLQHRANPNILSTRMETTLHFLCSQPDSAELRRSILDLLLAWHELELSSAGEEETVSINRVDVDGNTALHKASYSGLVQCVFALIDAGAIISIVNKHQLSCCECADENGYKELASVLELALMFQPEDDETASFIASQTFQYESQPSRLMPDCKSIRPDQVTEYSKELVSTLYNLIKDHAVVGKGITYSRTVVFLEKYSWDIGRVRSEFQTNPSLLFSNTNLPEVCIPYPKWDIGPWTAGAVNESTPEQLEELVAVETGSAGMSTDRGPVLSGENRSEVDGAGSEQGGVSINDISFDEEFLDSTETDKVVGEGDTAPYTDVTMDAVTVTTAANDQEMSDVQLVISDPQIKEAGDITALAASLSESLVAVEDTMRVKLLCPNIRVRVRPQPTTTVPEIGCASCGDEFEVLRDTVNGYFQLAKGKGFIQKQLAGVFWEVLDGDGNGVREFVKENCMICGEELFPPVPPSLLLVQASRSAAVSSTSLLAAANSPSLLSDSSSASPVCTDYQWNEAVPYLEQRAIYCSSGHGFCLNCWKMNSHTQVRENGAFSIKCPAYKCNEILGDEWLHVLLHLDSPESPEASPQLNQGGLLIPRQADALLNRYTENYSQHIVDCCKSLVRCPRRGCEHIVVCPDSFQAASQLDDYYNSMNSTSHSAVTAQISGLFVGCGICPDGHSFCLSCHKQAHSPCSCSDWSNWQKKVKDEMKALQLPGTSLFGEYRSPGYVLNVIISDNVKNAEEDDDGAEVGKNTNSEEVANAMWVAANTKQCPRCNSYIEKDEGCNHMR